MIKKISLAVTLGLLLISSASARSKESYVRELMEMNGVAQSMEQTMAYMIEQFRQIPEIPESYWTAFEEELDINELLNRLIPVYEKHFTKKELQQIIKFYKSPIGMKVSATQPLITQESMVIGQEFGEEVAQKILQTLQEDGYLEESAPENGSL